MEQPGPKERSIIRITDIEIAGSQIDDKIVGIFRFEAVGGKKGPTLLVVADIDSVGYVYDQFIDVVNHEAEHSRNLLSAVDNDPVTRFEKIVKNINEALAAFLAKEQTPINWNRINMFIIELSEGHLCLTGIGRLMNMFLQKQTDGTYKTYDLFGSLDQASDVDPKRVFSNIICGDFHNGDILAAGSRNFEPIRNELRMKERLTTLPPVSAALEIRQDLEARGIPDDFVATIVASVPASELSAEPRREPVGSTASLKQLERMERETAKQLGPTIAPQNADTSKGEPRAPAVGGPRNILAMFVGFFRRERVRDIATKVSLRGMNGGFGSFLGKKKKSLIVGAAALAVLVLIIGSVIRQQQTLAAERVAWNASYDQIRNTIERAEGEAVYSEDRARRSLAEATGKLAQLDASTDERREAITGLQAKSQALREKLRRAVAVLNPKVFYALADGIADGALVSPIVFKGRLVMADRSTKSIVSVRLDNGETKSYPLPDDAGRVLGIGGGNTSVIVMTEDRILLAVNLDSGDVGTLPIGEAEAQGANDLTVYANRLYYLDPGAEQIWRHQSSGGGFGGGQKYLQASAASLKDAVSIAIDSNVYILKRDGSLVRYFGGGQDGFSLSPIDPALTNGDQAWVHADNPYIAIADAGGKRVVLFTKEGKLVVQYESSAWKGPTDVVADPETKKLYVVDSNKVYELLLP
jgi:hypothetical protein